MRRLKHHLLLSFIPCMILATGKVQTNAETLDIVNVCYNSSLEGFMLNTTVLKTIVVLQRIDCVMECASDLCCRSINYKRTTTFKNESNCEMLHDVVYNTSEKLLETNSSFDYVYLVNPQKEYNINCFPKFLENNLQECKEPVQLGMENGEIKDSQISASSEWRNDHPAKNGRLNFEEPGKIHAWSAGDHDDNPWLEVDFEHRAVITQVMTQGRGDVSQWVKTFTLSYSDGDVFQQYTENGVEKVFSGNWNRNTIVSRNLSPVIITEKIRIHPKSWKGHPSLRVDFSGCLRECKASAQLGMENGEIKDSQISASSEWDHDHSAQNSRLNFNQPDKYLAWVSKDYDHSTSWLQVDFKNRTIITKVLIQGRGDLEQWVTNFTLSYSHGDEFQEYRKNGVQKVFSGNWDRNTIVYHNLFPAIITENIRIHPKTWYKHPALRVDFIGCLPVGENALLTMS